MSARPLNVILVISHDLGHQMSCYGVPGMRTENWDAFAEQGVSFSNYFCTAPQCSPSRSAIFTGRFPHANGVVGLAHAGFQNDLHPGERHLAQILAEAGYSTQLFGSQHVSPSWERCGFQESHGAGPCGVIAENAAAYLRDWSPEEGPLFMQVAFSEPHRPFRHDDVEGLDPSEIWVPPYLPDIPEVRENLVDFEASACSADRAFGKIVAALEETGRFEDSIVLYTVDHGIAFPYAKMTLYDPGLETALLMRVPGMEGGVVHDSMLSNVDLLPTLLDLLGLPVPENVQGRTFKGLLTGEAYAMREAIYGEKTYHTYYDPMRCIRTERWKLIANFEYTLQQESTHDFDNNARSYVEIAKAKPPFCQYHTPYELYDLQADPHEQHSLANEPAYAEVRDELIGRLHQWMVDTGDPLLDGPMAQGTYRARMAAFKDTAG